MIWDSKTGALVGEPLKGHSNEITSVSFSPDGRQIVTGSSDFTIKVWTFNPLSVKEFLSTNKQFASLHLDITK